ncbi:MAG: hypothetical protein RL174_802 [Actinomycetota bacterium]|jgi:hypothetical protein
MDLTFLAVTAVILVYAAILGLVAPYIGIESEHLGELVPGAFSFLLGMLLSLILTWAGLPYANAWFWIIVMLLMPAAAWFGPRWMLARRENA